MMVEEVTEQLRKTGCCEILTQGSGYCYIHRPDTSENPEPMYCFAGEGADWQPRFYASFAELWEAESHDFIRVV